MERETEGLVGGGPERPGFNETGSYELSRCDTAFPSTIHCLAGHCLCVFSTAFAGR